VSAVAGKPSKRVIVAVAGSLLGWMLVAIALHALMSTGTCSSNGYTQYGPVPHCPKGSGWYSVFLTVGIFLSAGFGVVVGSNFACSGLFLAIGVSSLLVAFSHHPRTGVAFPAVFGGGFLIGGLVWAAVAWNGRPIRPRARLAPVVASPVIAGSGLAGEPAGARLPSIGVRPVIAAVVWAAVVAGTLALGHLVAKRAGTSAAKVDVTRAPLPRPTGAAATIGPGSGSSLFRQANLARALGALTNRFGADGDIVALAIYPGQLDVVMADGLGNARLVTEGPTAALHVGQAVPFEGSRQAIGVSQVRADVPERLADEIAKLGGVPTAALDRFVLDLSGPLAAWQILPLRGDGRFAATLTGQHLQRVSAHGRQTLN
jgi:hypothetical protein